jgi:hypothetical protein
MKKLFPGFEGFFSGGKVYEPTGQSSTPRVSVTALSQPYVLRSKMREENISHGETVTASLSPVRLEMHHDGGILFFCPMKRLQVNEIVAKGDGGSIATQVKLEGLSAPPDCKTGLYELENIELSTNGVMLLRATDKTSWKPIESLEKDLA